MALSPEPPRPRPVGPSQMKGSSYNKNDERAAERRARALVNGSRDPAKDAKSYPSAALRSVRLNS